MDENKDIITADEIDVDPDPAVEVDIPVENLEEAVDIVETIETVEVNTVEEVEIDIGEGIGWDGGDNTRHSNLFGRDDPNQHPIEAISGLKRKLDTLRALKAVESDKIGVANYYRWAEGAYDEAGYFVSMVPPTTTIKLCEGKDIFGVTVGFAGFVGGQDGYTLDNVNGVSAIEGAKRDNTYALVATSGLVDVRCESDVKVGDYVVSNASGIAKKSVSKYGYKVIAIDNINGTEYASISLDVSAEVTDAIGQQMQNMSSDLDDASANIAAAMRAATEAYQKASESLTESNNANNQMSEALGKVEDMSSSVGSIQTQLGNLSAITAQTQEIANLAVTSAEAAKNDAISTANDALSKAGEIEKDMEAFVSDWTFIDPETGLTHTGATYVTTYIDKGLETKAELETVNKYNEENKLLIEKNAENYRQIMSSVDKYSVGPYSQAYNLTLAQARNILKDGMLYIPTRHKDTDTHSEEYEGATSPSYFTAGNCYIWTGSGSNTMWQENPNVVWFGETAPSARTYEYWYDGANLFILQDGAWLEVATLAGNVNNRVISMINQEVDGLSLSVTNTIGAVSGLDSRLSDTEASVNSVVSWPTEDGTHYLATIKQVADAEGSYLVLSAVTEDGVKPLSGATIVLGQDGEDSHIQLDADAIDLSGYVTISGLQGGTTAIDGACIQTGVIAADRLELSGVAKISDLESGTTTIDGACIHTGAIVSNNFVPGEDVFSEEGSLIDLTYGDIISPNFSVVGGNTSMKGRVVTNAGSIGGFEITDSGLRFVEEKELPRRNLFDKFAYTMVNGVCGFSVDKLEIGKAYTIKVSPEVRYLKISNTPSGYSSVHMSQVSEGEFVMTRHANISSSATQYIFIVIDVVDDDYVWATSASDLDEYQIKIYDNEEPIEKEYTTVFQLANPGVESVIGGETNSDIPGMTGVTGNYIFNVNNRMGIMEDGTTVFGADRSKYGYECQYMQYTPDGALEIKTSDGQGYASHIKMSDTLEMFNKADAEVTFSIKPYSQPLVDLADGESIQYGVKMDINTLGHNARWLVKVPEKYVFLREEAEASGNGEYINLFDILNNLLMP